MCVCDLKTRSSSSCDLSLRGRRTMLTLLGLVGAAVLQLSSVLAGQDAIKAAASLANVSTISIACLTCQSSLFWNTYRPQVYHGVRARSPETVLTGLMWIGLNDFTGNQGDILQRALCVLLISKQPLDTPARTTTASIRTAIRGTTAGSLRPRILSTGSKTSC